MIDPAGITWNGTAGSVFIPDDGTFPGNAHVPLVLYRGAVPEASGNPEAVESLFSGNGWGSMWRNGIYSYHHYHSTAHEVLGVYNGTASVQLGGPGRSAIERG